MVKSSPTRLPLRASQHDILWAPFGKKFAWEPTPIWMFWKPMFRRLVVPPVYSGKKTVYEYQNHEFVIREFLEERYGPR